MNQTKVTLSDGQRKKLANGKQVNFRLSRENLVGNDTLLLSKRELNKLNKARANGKGVVLQVSGMAGGSLVGLAAAALPMAAKALGLAGLSFGAEKLLGKIFGSGNIPPNAVQLAKMVEMLTQEQKKMIRNVLKRQGIVSGSGQRGGFLGLLASLGIPLAISLVKKVLGKGVSLQPSKGKGVSRPTAGKGMRLQPPPPIVGSWGKKNSWMFL